MFIRKTIIKAGIIFALVIVLIVVIQYLPFFSTKKQSISPSPTQTQAPTMEVKTGWTKDAEQSILNQCPLKAFNPGLCQCALSKVEQRYSFDQAMALYAQYQKTRAIDPALQSIIASCAAGR